MELIRQEIDGKPVQGRLVSALLLATTIGCPEAADVGGSFKHIPLCRTTSQTGCIVTFVSFRSTLPPSAETLFGKVADSTMTAGLHESGGARRREW